MEVELITKRDDDNRPTIDRVNIEQSASGRLEGRVLQLWDSFSTSRNFPKLVFKSLKYQHGILLLPLNIVMKFCYKAFI